MARRRRRFRKTKYLLYSSNTWEVREDFSIIFEELVSNHMLSLIKVEDEVMQQSSSTHEALKNETDLIATTSGNSYLVNAVEVQGENAGPVPQIKSQNGTAACLKQARPDLRRLRDNRPRPLFQAPLRRGCRFNTCRTFGNGKKSNEFL